MSDPNNELCIIEDELSKLDNKAYKLQLERQTLVIRKKQLLKPVEWNHEIGWFIWRALFFHPNYVDPMPEWFEFKYSYERDEVIPFEGTRTTSASLFDNLKLYSDQEQPNEKTVQAINVLRNNTVDGTVEIYKPQDLEKLPKNLQAYLQEKMK